MENETRNIEERVKASVVTALGLSSVIADRIEPDMKFTEDPMDADSLDVIEIANCLEEEFDIEIPDVDIDTAMPLTVREATAYIEKKLAAGVLN